MKDAKSECWQSRQAYATVRLNWAYNGTTLYQHEASFSLSTNSVLSRTQRLVFRSFWAIAKAIVSPLTSSYHSLLVYVDILIHGVSGEQGYPALSNPAYAIKHFRCLTLGSRHVHYTEIWVAVKKVGSQWFAGKCHWSAVTAVWFASFTSGLQQQFVFIKIYDLKQTRKWFFNSLRFAATDVTIAPGLFLL